MSGYAMMIGIFLLIFTGRVCGHMSYDIIDFIDEGAIMSEILLAIFSDLLIVFNHVFKVIEKLLDSFHFSNVYF